MKKYKIYALQKDEFIYYIGITCQTLKARKKCGWKFTEHNKFLKSCYMYVLEETNDKEREYFYIQIFNELGHPLLNKVKGELTTADKINYMKTYYKQNKEKCLSNMKKYQEEHKEEQRNYRREYYKKYNKDNAEHLRQKRQELYLKKKQEKNENDQSNTGGK